MSHIHSYSLVSHSSYFWMNGSFSRSALPLLFSGSFYKILMRNCLNSIDIVLFDGKVIFFVTYIKLALRFLGYRSIFLFQMENKKILVNMQLFQLPKDLSYRYISCSLLIQEKNTKEYHKMSILDLRYCALPIQNHKSLQHPN